MTWYCSLVHFIKWILALTGRLHFTCFKIWSNSHWLWNGALLRKSFIPTLRKLKKTSHTEQYQRTKTFQFSFFSNFCKLLSKQWLWPFSSDAVKVITKPVGWYSYIKLGSRHIWCGIHTTAQTKICTSAKRITYHYCIMAAITMTFLFT